MADEHLIKHFQLMMTIYSVDAFGILPDKVIIITLFDGKENEYSPTIEDVLLGQQYMKNLKKTKIKHTSWERRS
jgi:hypothetical protein